jgi:hypothetical protein
MLVVDETRFGATLKRTLAIVTLAVVVLMTAAPAITQQRPQPPSARHGQRRTQGQAGGKRQVSPTSPIYQRRDTWYEFLLKQFNPTNLDYGAWMEQRRQLFLDASVRNPYFNYSAAVTIALLLLAVVCAKQWIDHRRTMWITAEMMADLYNHDLYSRDVAENAIQKYNQHIKRCNRAIEAAQHGTAVPGSDSDQASWKAQLDQVTEERDRYKRERDAAQRELDTNRLTLTELSLRVEGMSIKQGNSGKAGPSVELNSSDLNVVRLINNLQEQLVVERNKNRQLKGA